MLIYARTSYQTETDTDADCFRFTEYVWSGDRNARRSREGRSEFVCKGTFLLALWWIVLFMCIRRVDCADCMIGWAVL